MSASRVQNFDGTTNKNNNKEHVRENKIVLFHGRLAIYTQKLLLIKEKAVNYINYSKNKKSHSIT